MSARFQDIAHRGLRAAMVIDEALSGLNDPFDNYQRSSLRDAQASLNAIGEAMHQAMLRDQKEPGSDLEAAYGAAIDKHMAAAVHTLGDGIDHAHRPGWTETRREVGVCVEAFNILTAKGATA
ncbi:MAG: hypothetical protein U5L74_01560 [Ideonella sp.]|nr:hypothetical protein [Ideonella sp.]